MPDNPLHALPLHRAGPPPGSAGVATVLLHGRGRSAGEMLDLAARLHLPRMPFVAVQAAGGTWYPESFLAERARNEPHLGWALERVEGVLRDLVEEGVPRGRIALLGFSQGACLATEHALRTPGQWGALVAFTGGFIGPAGTSWQPAASAGAAETPVLLTGSDVDEWVPMERVEATAGVFRAMGCAVDLRVCRGREHTVSDEELAAARGLLADWMERRDTR